MCRTKLGIIVTESSRGAVFVQRRGAAAAGALLLSASLLAGSQAVAAPEHSAHAKRDAGGAGSLLFQLQGSGGRGG